MRKIWPLLEHPADRVVDGAARSRRRCRAASRRRRGPCGVTRPCRPMRSQIGAEQVRPDGEIEGADAVGIWRRARRRDADQPASPVASSVTWTMRDRKRSPAGFRSCSETYLTSAFTDPCDIVAHRLAGAARDGDDAGLGRDLARRDPGDRARASACGRRGLPSHRRRPCRRDRLKWFSRSCLNSFRIKCSGRGRPGGYSA